MVSRLKDTLLLVGDANSDRIYLRQAFASTYDILEAENIEQAVLLLEQNSSCIAIVLADVPLEDKRQFRLLSRSCHAGEEDEIPLLLFVTPAGTGEQEELAFALGATDVVLRPYTQPSIQRRVQIMVEFFQHKWHLQNMVQEQSQTIRSANQVMVDALSAIIEHRSTESGNHVLRIRRFTQILLEDVAATWPEYGLTEQSMQNIASASTLHDIGKISIPDAILNKPGKLTDEEFEIMKTHTTVGAQLVHNLSGIGEDDYLRYAYNIALYHHERWDGWGYPCGLRGDEIPICAQVVGIADVFDALTTQRVYKQAYSYEKAFNMILNGECGTFSPKLLECLKHVRSQFVALAHQYADGHSPKSDSITVPLPGPVWKSHALDTAQLSQVKYQTILHYLNDTVLELDLDSGVYHMVYNPNPELDRLLPDASFKGIMRAMKGMQLHPEDREKVERLPRFIGGEFFERKLRRHAVQFRVFDTGLNDWQTHELTFLRVNTGNEEQRTVIAIWNEGGRTEVQEPQSHNLSPIPLRGMVGTVLRCQADAEQTMDIITESMYTLTGYTREEIDREFGGKLLRMIHPDDLDSVVRQGRDHMKTAGRKDYEYRLLRKNAPAVWVLDKTRGYMEKDGQEYLYHVIEENTRNRAVRQQLEETAERYQTAIAQIDGILFEWDAQSDTMHCSERWEKRFGYAPISEHFTAQVTRASHFHPDDLLQLRESVDRMRKYGQDIHLDVRIANQGGKYVWCRIRGSAKRERDGRISRVLGIVTDIDAMKRASLALKEKAERDALTKLLNRESAQEAIAEYLQGREGQTLAAMLVLDLDNFKTVNDTYGHLYGDAVLSRVGSLLRRQFRANDTIARIGGDEFLILLQDVPTEEMVQERCRRVLEAFRNMLEEMMPDLNVSCSIGVAMAPSHGTVYSELFKHADEALYLAKSRGKNAFCVYDPVQLLNAAGGEGTRTTTRIDSDEQPGMANGSFVRYVFRQLYESSDVESTIDHILAYVGEQFNVSRTYIFENNEDNTTCSNTFEWCNQGIEPEKDMLQNVSYIEDIAGWPQVFNEKGVFYCTDISALEPHFRAILEPQGIKSMLQCAIMDNGVFRGYVGFDECGTNRLWTQEQVDMLEFLAEVLAVFLLKQRSRDKAVRQADNLQSILDRQEEWVYVVDPETCQLQFMNDKIRRMVPEAQLGMTCHQAFMGRSSRCEKCPIPHIGEGQGAHAVIQSDKLGVTVQAHAVAVSWNAKQSCLITSREQEKQK